MCVRVRVHVCLTVCSCFSLRRGTARWFSQWRLSPALGSPVCVCVCVHSRAVCLYKCTVKTTCWWVALYLGFQLYAVSYQLNLSSFLFQITTHAHEQTHLRVCVWVYVCLLPLQDLLLFTTMAQSKRMTYQSCFLSLLLSEDHLEVF